MEPYSLRKRRKVLLMCDLAYQEREYTALDEGEGGWKIEDGTAYVNELSWVNHPSKDPYARWKRVASVENISEVRVYDWAGDKLIESTEL